MLVHPTHLVLLSAILSNKIFCVHLFLIQNHIYFCVPATKARWILFLNHRNRKVVGGKHNILVHYVDKSAPILFGVVLCNPIKWDMLWFISGQKSWYFCVPAIKVKWILFLNHRNRKVVGGKHNDLVHYVNVCAGVVLWYPIKWDMLWFIISDPKSLCLCACHKSEMNFIPQPHG